MGMMGMMPGQINNFRSMPTPGMVGMAGMNHLVPPQPISASGGGQVPQMPMMGGYSGAPIWQ